VSSSFGNSELDRVIQAAQAPEWQVGYGPSNSIEATKESGVDGMPWVVLARRRGRGMEVSLYQPGDDTTIEGDVIGEIAGNPRDMGRQLRDLLTDLSV